MAPLEKALFYLDPRFTDAEMLQELTVAGTIPEGTTEADINAIRSSSRTLKELSPIYFVWNNFMPQVTDGSMTLDQYISELTAMKKN